MSRYCQAINKSSDDFQAIIQSSWTKIGKNITTNIVTLSLKGKVECKYKTSPWVCDIKGKEKLSKKCYFFMKDLYWYKVVQLQLFHIPDLLQYMIRVSWNSLCFRKGLHKQLRRVMLHFYEMFVWIQVNNNFSSYFSLIPGIL